MEQNKIELTKEIKLLMLQALKNGFVGENDANTLTNFFSSLGILERMRNELELYIAKAKIFREIEEQNKIEDNE